MKRKIIVTVIVILLVVTTYLIIKTTVLSKVSKFEKSNVELIETGKKEKEAAMQDGKEPEKELEEYLKEKYSKPESAVEYLFSIALQNDVNSYPGAFSQEQIQDDLFNRKEKDKEKLVQDILSRLTRDGKLTTVKVLKGMMVFEKDSIRVICDLFYEDRQSPVRVNIKVKKEKMEHLPHGDTDFHDISEYYYIDSSVWEIINKIENSR
ncbi:hypothetical protein [Cytobacillus solani]|uniref:Uncharacterized protein n=1 Tax=Cytobacillus solani TaxID=1637975 RepID=A0A0Q3VHP6_9BACI|nr:hypothetical protein [Cytobacillus solani]KOP82381.1 hypothetical protein AMS60_07725 [Bacillus sp. FJAT-21945]KQL19391.1 hypothetical protein AN957_12995 [Cytobacillus solani]